MAASPPNLREGHEPRWIAGTDTGGNDPLAVYEQTYSAMSAGLRAGGGRRRWRPASVLLVLAAGVAALAVLPSTRPDPGRWLPAIRPFGAGEATSPLPQLRAAYAPEVIGTTPARPKAVLHVGDQRDFAVAAAGPDLHYGWTVDGIPTGTGPRWSYAPGPAEIGRRHVEVVVTGREGVEHRAWAVRVKAARPPHLRVDPPPGTLQVASGGTVHLSVDAEPATPGERLRTSWQVDGTPTAQGDTFSLRPQGPGSKVVRAVVRSTAGSVSMREWVLDVAPPPPPPVQVALASEPPPAEPNPPIEAPAPRVGARETDATRSLRGPERREDDVRRWLERYADAWRAHDVDALRRMGQVTTEREADALRAYFDTVRELDVELNVIALSTDGDRTTVRFTRRDRFRDPAGRLVLKESPTLVKQIVRTPEGLRFARPTG